MMCTVKNFLKMNLNLENCVPRCKLCCAVLPGKITAKTQFSFPALFLTVWKHPVWNRGEADRIGKVSVQVRFMYLKFDGA